MRSPLYSRRRQYIKAGDVSIRLRCMFCTSGDLREGERASGEPIVVNLKYTITLNDIKIKTHIPRYDRAGTHAARG